MHCLERGRPWQETTAIRHVACTRHLDISMLGTPFALRCKVHCAENKTLALMRLMQNPRLVQRVCLRLHLKPPLPARAQVSGLVVGTFQQPPPNKISFKAHIIEGLRTWNLSRIRPSAVANAAIRASLPFALPHVHKRWRS